MAQISRLRNAEIANGNLINADDIAAELDQLVASYNADDTVLTNVATGNITLSGIKTFSSPPLTNAINERTTDVGVTIDSLLIKDGTVISALAADPGTPVEGMFWYNTTTHLLKFYNGTIVEILSTSADLLVAVPSVSGKSGKFLTNNGSVTSWSVDYDSGNQTITNAGSLTLAHGRGITPKDVKLFLKCLTAEAGYSIGDEMLVGPDHYSTQDVSSRGFSVVADATNINIRIGSDGVSVINKSSGSGTAITNANWALIVRSFA